MLISYSDVMESQRLEQDRNQNLRVAKEQNYTTGEAVHKSSNCPKFLTDLRNNKTTARADIITP